MGAGNLHEPALQSRRGLVVALADEIFGISKARTTNMSN